MRVTAESTRKLFIMRHGEAAFESIAKRYAEVGEDYSQVDLSSVPAWRDFIVTLKFVPSSEVLMRAFVWCTRHRERLSRIDQPTVPASLERFEDPRVLRQLFEVFPYFIANSQNGYRCEGCFIGASQMLDELAKQPSRGRLQQLIAQVEHSNSVAMQSKSSVSASE